MEKVMEIMAGTPITSTMVNLRTPSQPTSQSCKVYNPYTLPTCTDIQKWSPCTPL
uniref:Uncharacterized protein n=1 Tax=Anguilla anguilla TaxID=7936 RepID=A0A0E9WI88_ANGAN